MRKGLLFSALALGMGLFSCTQEDLTNQTVANGGPVTVSVALPGDGSRAVPVAPEGYDLRCVLQVVYTDGVNGTETYTEMAGDAGANITFKFQPLSDQYDCLFWADYVTEGTETDRFYNTSDLTKVGYVESALADGSLFNNDACDAFCGRKDAQSIMDAGNQVNVTLLRPFMKMSIADKRSVSGDQLDVTINNMPSGYNVLTGESDNSTVTMTMPATDLSDNEGNVWFSTYMFAPSNLSVFDAENITMGVTTDGSREEKYLTGSINVGANTTYTGNVSFALGEVDIEVGIEGDSNLAEVGDYYYSDGTWSSDYIDTKTVIGVVFATFQDNAATDDPANYADVTFAKDYIRGWVVGLKELAPTPRFCNSADGKSGVNVEKIEGVNTGADDIMGYANGLAWQNNVLSAGVTYATLDKIAAYAADYAAPAPANTSGWYLGAIGQMDILRTAYNAEGSAVRATLEALQAEGLADLFATGTGGSAYYWSSTANAGSDSNSVQTVVFDSSVEKYTTTHGGNSGRHARPILTF